AIIHQLTTAIAKRRRRRPRRGDAASTSRSPAENSFTAAATARATSRIHSLSLVAGPPHPALMTGVGIAKRTTKDGAARAAFRHHDHRSLPHTGGPLLHASARRARGARDQGRAAAAGRRGAPI